MRVGHPLYLGNTRISLNDISSAARDPSTRIICSFILLMIGAIMFITGVVSLIAVRNGPNMVALSIYTGVSAFIFALGILCVCVIKYRERCNQNMIEEQNHNDIV